MSANSKGLLVQQPLLKGWMPCMMRWASDTSEGAPVRALLEWRQGCRQWHPKGNAGDGIPGALQGLDGFTLLMSEAHHFIAQGLNPFSDGCWLAGWCWLPQTQRSCGCHVYRLREIGLGMRPLMHDAVCVVQGRHAARRLRHGWRR